MKVVLLLSTLLLLLANCNDTTDTGWHTTSQNLFETEMLKELNFVRTQPKAYAESRLATEYQKGDDNGAYAELVAMTPVGKLALQNQLTAAAQKYAETLSQSSRFSHTEDGTPQERCEREGYQFFGGENIAAGSYARYNFVQDPEGAAHAFIKTWIIDTGVDGVGHRRNILNKQFMTVGIGGVENKNSSLVYFAVQDFGRQ